ncbi:MAG: glucose-6-phosphate dehydrogenase (NADP(+)), partial [Mesorhizobium sp.]
MTSQIIPVEPFDFVIFGGTGDLSERKLLPSLYHRQRGHQFSEPTRIIGTSRSKMTDEEFQAFAKQAISDHVKPADIDATELKTFLARLSYVSADATNGAGFDKLKTAIGDSECIRAFYLAVAPALFGDISHKLKENGLITPNSRIVLEKPIGRDLASARELNDLVGDDFHESQIFRIDHYLGKETVQNLMALRFANALYEPLWNSANVDHVQITVAETVGLEDRVTYYDKAGALRDMVQNHMLQLLCLVAMEAPSSMDADAVRDEKLKVLRALKRINGNEAPKHTVRGQYRAGASAGGPVKGYVEELGRNSNT